jgi:hypothetical protein
MHNQRPAVVGRHVAGTARRVEAHESRAAMANFDARGHGDQHTAGRGNRHGHLGAGCAEIGIGRRIGKVGGGVRCALGAARPRWTCRPGRSRRSRASRWPGDLAGRPGRSRRPSGFRGASTSPSADRWGRWDRVCSCLPLSSFRPECGCRRGCGDGSFSSHRPRRPDVRRSAAPGRLRQVRGRRPVAWLLRPGPPEHRRLAARPQSAPLDHVRNTAEHRAGRWAALCRSEAGDSSVKLPIFTVATDSFQDQPLAWCLV